MKATILDTHSTNAFTHSKCPKLLELKSASLSIGSLTQGLTIPIVLLRTPYAIFIIGVNNSQPLQIRPTRVSPKKQKASHVWVVA